MSCVKVSYILFSYNQERFIEDAVFSAINQTYENIEFIFSDDCSTDLTFDIIKKISQESNKNIKINRNTKNLGIGSHISELLKIATGELIVISAGDDISEKNRVETLVIKWLKYNRPDMIGSSLVEIDSNNRLIQTKLSSDYAYQSDSKVTFPLEFFLSNKNPAIAGCTMAYSRKLATVFPEFDTRIFSEDMVFYFRAMLIGDVYLIKDKLVKYRRSDSSYSNSTTLDKNGKSISIVKYSNSFYLNLFEQYKKDYIFIKKNSINDNFLNFLNKKICHLKSSIRLNNIDGFFEKICIGLYLFFTNKISIKLFLKNI